VYKGQRYLASFKSSIGPRAHGSFAIGPVNYAYLERLQNVTAIPLARLLNVGESALASDRAAFIAAAKRIDPTRSPQAVYASLGAQHPAADRILRTAQNVPTSLVAFITAPGIIDLPSAPIAKVIATPKFQAQTSFASMDSPGPLEARATEAYYRVTVPDPSWSSRQVHEQLAFLNDYALPIISLHEVYPGHYTNYLFNKQAHLSLIRKLNWNPAFGEGWAMLAAAGGPMDGSGSEVGVSAGKTGAKVARASRADLGGGKDVAHVEGAGSVAVDGGRGEMVYFELPASATDGAQVYYVAGRRGFVFTLGTQPGQRDAALPLFAGMLQTFKPQ